MNLFNRKWHLASTIIVLGGVLVAATYPKTPICKQAVEWAGTHRDSLPTTLAGFAKYTSVYRRAIYGTLSKEHKIGLWREHFATFRTAGTLTAEQQRFLAEVDRDLESTIESADSPTKRARFKEMEQRINALFGHDLGRRLFSLRSLGAPSETATDPSTGGPNHAQREFCNCNPESQGFDCGSGYCDASGSDCWPVPTWPGCGPLSEAPGTGLC
jgi:hypothetical protein